MYTRDCGWHQECGTVTKNEVTRHVDCCAEDRCNSAATFGFNTILATVLIVRNVMM